MLAQRQQIFRSLCLSQQSGFPQCLASSQHITGLATAATGGSSSGTNSSGETSQSPLDYLMFVPSAVCAVLAAWQLDRRQQKVQLVEGRMQALSGTAQDIFNLPSVPERNTLVSWSGAYDEAASQFVGPRPKTFMGVPEKGWILVTPVYSSDGKRAILVRRGWVPDSWRTQHAAQHLTIPHISTSTTKSKSRKSWWWFGGSKEASKSGSESSILGVGVVTGGETANSLSFPNEPETGSWHWLDAPGMASFSGLPENTPLVEAVEVGQEAGAPRTAMQIATDKYRTRGEPRSPAPQAPEYPEPKKRDQFLEFSVMPYDHLNYAITWAMLCAATAFLARRLLTKGSGPTWSKSRPAQQTSQP